MATQTNAQPEAQAPKGPPIPAPCGYCRHCTIAVDDNVVFCEPRCERLWKEERERLGK